MPVPLNDNIGKTDKRNHCGRRTKGSPFAKQCHLVKEKTSYTQISRDVGGYFFTYFFKKGLDKRAILCGHFASKMALVVRGVSRTPNYKEDFTMTLETVKKALTDTIQAMSDYRSFFCKRPGIDNTRNRKFPFSKMLSAILALRGGSLNREIMDFFGVDPSIGTSSAFIQQRAKIIPAAFESLFHHFTDKVDENKRYNGLRLLAVDGSDLRYAFDPNDPDAVFVDKNGGNPCNMLHINALYDLIQHTYVDALLRKRNKSDEEGALTEMVDRSNIDKVLVIADRGYEAYNVLAHIQEKGWFFLIRIKDGPGGIASGLTLPDSPEYDISFDLNLTRRQTNDIKLLLKDKNHYKAITSRVRLDYLPKPAQKDDPVLFYNLHFRIVHFPISDSTYETIITNLDPDLYPLEEIKRLYAMRWGIETSFRDLKYTLGLLHLHAKKVEFVQQEVFAKLTMYNFCEFITQSVVIRQGQRKHTYKVNFSDAVHVCFHFFLRNLPPPIVEAMLRKYISPIRPGREDTRKLSQKSAASFTYRVA